MPPKVPPDGRASLAAAAAPGFLLAAMVDKQIDNMCICVCIYIYIHTYILYKHVCIYIYMYIYIYT